MEAIMGVLLWIVTGLAAVAIVRWTVHVIERNPWNPAIGTSLLGAVLGGFAVDLVMRGDSVMNFRGPTLVGAVAGALLFLGVSYLVGGSPGPSRPSRRHV